MKPYTKWTTRENARLFEMLASGSTHKEISEALGRSKSAVTARVTERNRPRALQLVPDVEYPTARVSKQDVIDWYELGWRVVGISQDSCAMEWRLQRAPEYPRALIEVSTAHAPQIDSFDLQIIERREYAPEAVTA